jgi:hypothetical protein
VTLISRGRGSAVRQPLGTPSAERFANAECAAQVVSGPARLVYGFVRDPAGERPIPGATVRLITAGGERELRADDNGAYRGCVLAGYPSVRVAAGMAGRPRHTDEIREFPVTGLVMRADVELGEAAIPDVTVDAARAGEVTVWTNAIVGTVTSQADGTRVTSAVVALLLADGEVVASTISDARGRFQIAHPDLGDRYVVRVTIAGYRPATQDVVFRPGQQLELNIELLPESRS